MRVAAFMVSLAMVAAVSSAEPTLEQIQQQLAGTLKAAEAKDWARPDGYTYAIDVGLLLCWSAETGEHDVYDRARQFVTEKLLRHEASDPFTDGFIVWRVRDSQPADASGTTEALRIAEGLWRGSRRFSRPDDRALALRILRGYARHAGTDHSVWLVRNYFNFQTRAFATNSYLVDYDPDFLAEVAAATGDADLAELAQRSYEAIEKAVAPSGLIYDLIQPEVATLMPDLRMTAFSPNDIVGVGNAADVARACALGRPAVGQRLLNFALRQGPELRMYYTGREARVLNDDAWAGPQTIASLLRLAVRLEDAQAVQTLLPILRLKTAQWLSSPPDSSDARLYTACLILLALEEAGQAE